MTIKTFNSETVIEVYAGFEVLYVKVYKFILLQSIFHTVVVHIRLNII